MAVVGLKHGIGALVLKLIDYHDRVSVSLSLVTSARLRQKPGFPHIRVQAETPKPGRVEEYEGIGSRLAG